MAAASLGVCAKRVETIPTTGKQGLNLFPKALPWSVNNYKKIMQAKVTSPDGKTPSGSEAVRIAFSGKGGGCNVIAPNIPVGGAWRGSGYKALTMSVKGISGATNAQLVVYTTAGKKFSWRVNFVPGKWTEVTLLKANAYNRQGDKLEFNKLKGMYFTSYAAVDFAFGDMRLISSGSSMKITSESAMMLPVCKIAPKIDGSLDDPVYKQARKIELITTSTGQTPKEKTTVYLLTADNKLYLGAKIYASDTSKLVADKKQHDAPVYQDDCIELFANDRLDEKSYRHIVVNSIGTLQDYQYRFDQTKESFIYDYAWNPDVTVKSKLEKNCWTIEFSVPMAQMGLAPGKPFTMQIGRENPRLKEYCAMTLTKRFTEVYNYALACFGNFTNKLSDLNIKYTPPGSLLINGKTSNATLAGQIIVADSYAKVVTENFKSKIENDAFSFPFAIKTPVSGNYSCVVNVPQTIPERLQFTLRLPPEISYGDLYLNPLPKNMKKLEDTFSFDSSVQVVVDAKATKRTRKTARLLRADIMHDLFGFNCPITDEPGSGKSFILKVQPGFKKLPAEGYYLKISPDGVIITGADEAGLYYGVVTLRQIVRSTLIKKHQPVLPCLEITDWPDLKKRMIVNNLFGYRRLKSPRLYKHEIKRYIKEVVAGSKLNLYSLQLKFAVEFDKQSKIMKLEAKIPREDLAEIARYCKEHFVDFVPALQSGGHSQFMTMRYKGLQDPDYDQRQSDVTYPGYYKMLFSMYEDILDAVPDAKYFHILHDEWWQHPKKDHAYALKGIPRWKLYAEDIKKIHAFFKKRNIRILMYADMLLSNHNGGGVLQTAKALDELPKDIIMTNWSLRTCPDSSMFLYKKGFEVWDTVNQFRCVPEKDKQIISGYGTLAYLHNWQTFWYSRDKILPDYSHGPFRAGQYAWNLKSDKDLPIGEWRSRYFNNVKAMYFFPKRRTTNLDFRMLPLEKAANSETAKWFDAPKLAPALTPGKQTIGFIPFMIPKGKVIAATGKQQEVSIPVNKAGLRGLIFLQTCYVPKGGLKFLKERSKEYQYGVPVGELRVEYNTGPSEIIPLRFGMNTLNYRPLPAARFMFDTRYTYDLKTVGGNDAAMYIIEWANEYKQRTVRRVVLRTYDTPAIPVIFGITGYSEAKKK